jgi:hypothetical protein
LCGFAFTEAPKPLSASAVAAEDSPTNVVVAQALSDGSESCTSCHLKETGGYQQTAHFATSNLPDSSTVLGCFEEGCNLLKIADPAPVIQDPGVSYRMEKQPSGFYETAITGFPGQMQTRSERMDVVIGSGARGQSYLFWHGDQLFASAKAAQEIMMQALIRATPVG